MFFFMEHKLTPLFEATAPTFTEVSRYQQAQHEGEHANSSQQAPCIAQAVRGRGREHNLKIVVSSLAASVHAIVYVIL